MNPNRSLLFDRWPRFAARHPWRVIAGAIVIILALAFSSNIFGGNYVNSFTIPGAESQRAFELLSERFPQQAGDTATVVIKADAGIEASETQDEIAELVASLSDLPHVVQVSAPDPTRGEVSSSGTIARFDVLYDRPAFELPEEAIELLFELREETSRDGFQVELGGFVATAGEQEEPGQAELIGLIAAAVILLIAFGSVVAMGLPIIIALAGLIPGFMLIVIVARFADIATFTPQFASMIGIGVGIDYALLIVTRFRECISNGMSTEDAVARAMGAAGRAVLFAGAIVMIALLGLWASGIAFIGWIATSAVIVVCSIVVVALFLLPAILALLGHRINRLSVPFLGGGHSGGGVGESWSRVIQRFPVVFLILSLALMITLTLPFFSMRLGSADAGSNPETATTRRAYDLLSEGFGPGFNGPILIVMDIAGEQARERAKELMPMFSEEDGVAFVSLPVFNPEGDAALMTIFPATAPQDEATSDLIQRLRARLAADVASDDLTPLVGSPTAIFIDLANQIADSMPLFFAAVIGLSVILLAVVFRSILVPIKAALMILLSVGVGLGVVTAIFQWGWLSGLLGVTTTGPVESFLPMMIFAIVFGLSMDYEVFLLTRVQEEYLTSGKAAAAVQRGQAITFRVIIAAALIMSSVFLSFTLVDTRVIKEFGFGLGITILADAIIVRMILVPSAMHLFGEKAWWFPAWLARITPNIGVEGEPRPAR